MSNLVSNNYQQIVNFSENASKCFHCSPNSNYYCQFCTNSQITVNTGSLLEYFTQYEMESGRSRTSSLSESIPHNRSYSPTLRPLSPINYVSDSHIITSEACDSKQSMTRLRRPSQPHNLSVFKECFGAVGDDSTRSCERCYKIEQFPSRCENCRVFLCTSCAAIHLLDVNMKDHLISRIGKPSIAPFSAAVGSEIRTSIRQVFEDELASSLSLLGRQNLEETMTLVPFNSMIQHSIMDGVTKPLPDTSQITRENVEIVHQCGHNLLNDYCTRCFILICSSCRNEHISHEILSIPDSQEVFREIFLNLVNESDKRVKEASSACNVAQDIFQHLDSVEVRTINLIETTFSDIINVLSVRKKNLISMANTITRRKKETLTNQMKILQQSKLKLMGIQTAAKSSLYCNSISEQVELHGKIEMEMKSMEHTRMFHRPHEDDTLSFISPVVELCRNLKTFGTIDCCGHAKYTYPFGVNVYNVIIGWNSQISVQSVRSSGEKRHVGGDDIKAFMYSDKNECEQLSVQDHGTGLYTVRFKFERTPKTISVTIRDQHIMNMPFTPTVKMFVPYNTRMRPTLKFGNGIKRPWGIHCDGDGYIYVTDRTNNCVHIFNHEGKLVHKFGSYGILPGCFNRPAGITVDANRRIIVTDKDNHRVQIFTFSGKFLLTFGHGGENDGELCYPWGVDIDIMGNIVVADTRNYRVQVFDPSGKHLHTISSGPVKMQHTVRELESPRGLCCTPTGEVFVTDFNRNRIAVISKDYQSSSLKYFGREGTDDRGFYRPQGITIDGLGHILIVDTRNRRLSVYSIYGKLICHFAVAEGIIPILCQPLDIAVSPDGHVFVVELEKECVYRF